MPEVGVVAQWYERWRLCSNASATWWHIYLGERGTFFFPLWLRDLAQWCTPWDRPTNTFPVRLHPRTTLAWVFSMGQTYSLDILAWWVKPPLFLSVFHSQCNLVQLAGLKYTRYNKCLFVCLHYHVLSFLSCRALETPQYLCPCLCFPQAIRPCETPHPEEGAFCLSEASDTHISEGISWAFVVFFGSAMVLARGTLYRWTVKWPIQMTRFCCKLCFASSHWEILAACVRGAWLRHAHHCWTTGATSLHAHGFVKEPFLKTKRDQRQVHHGFLGGTYPAFLSCHWLKCEFTAMLEGLLQKWHTKGWKKETIPYNKSYAMQRNSCTEMVCQLYYTAFNSKRSESN